MSQISSVKNATVLIFPSIQRIILKSRNLPILPIAIIVAVLFLAIFANLISPHDPERSVKDTETGRPIDNYMPPFWMDGGSIRTPLGTDFHSRDILSRLIHGTRVSLIVGLVGTLAAGMIGTTLGITAGYLGGWWDQIIMRVTDAWLALPSLIFAIFLASVLRPSLWNIVIILALVFWSRYTRQIRAEVLALRERDYVRLAEVTGASKLRVMIKHILPNISAPITILATLQVGNAILVGSGLSFLGMGAQPPTPESVSYTHLTLPTKA